MFTGQAKRAFGLVAIAKPLELARCRLPSALIVGLGIVSTLWADVALDAGTRRVLQDGHRVLYDTGVLAGASAAVVGCPTHTTIGAGRVLRE
jgi:hypothetical protein